MVLELVSLSIVVCIKTNNEKEILHHHHSL